MADQADTTAGDSAGLLTLTRIKRNALTCLVLGALASIWFRSLGVTLGFIGGGVVAVVNFRWIEAGLDAAMGGPMSSRKRALAVAKFVLRYVLLGLVIYAIVASRIVDLKAFLAGLFIFVVSIMWEAFRLTLISIRSGRA